MITESKPYSYQCKKCEAVSYVSDYKNLSCICGSKDFQLMAQDKSYPNAPYILGSRGNVSLAQLHSIYQSLLYIEDYDRLDIVLAVALSRKLPGIRLWLILVGPSGDMKSVQLNAIRGEDVYLLHNLTSKSLVNGFKDKKAAPDLAPKLDDKITIIPDMSQILKLPPNEKGELWGQLRDLYDGYAGRESGMGSSAKYENLRVTLLAGSTPAIDGQILVHQDLGTREIIYRTHGNKNQDLVMQKCLENEEYESSITKKLREVTRSFLDSTNPVQIELSDSVTAEIKRISQYIVYMRTTGDFDSYTNELRNYVYPEEPTRITKQLRKLYVSLKNLSPDYPDETALRICWKVGKSCAFPVRISIFDYLRETAKSDIEKDFSTSQLANFFNVGKGTVKRECSVMEALGLIKCRRQETTYPDRPYEYWSADLSNEFVKSLLESEKGKPSGDIVQDLGKNDEKPSGNICQGYIPIMSPQARNNNNNIYPYYISPDGFNNTNLSQQDTPAVTSVAESNPGDYKNNCLKCGKTISLEEVTCLDCKQIWANNWNSKDVQEVDGP